MKKTFKYSILLFVCLLILSCTNEKNFLNEKDHHSKISEKSFDELSKMPSFTNAFEKIPKKSKSSSLLSDSRSAIEEEFDFTFSDKPAKVIEAADKTSYTFLIYRTEEDSSFFENLIIEINKQMKSRAVITKYIPSVPLVVEQENKVNFEGNITSIKLFDEINPNEGGWMMPTCYLVYTSLCVTPPDCGGMICGFGVVNWCTTADGPTGGGGGGGSGANGPSSSNNLPNNLNNINTNPLGVII